MKKLFLLTAACLLIYQAKAMAIPSQITYQGTLKQNGVPTNATKNMTFQLLSSDGQTAYSKIINVPVTVVNGLFSVPLTFQLVPPYTWDAITPYIQVSVEGQALSPNEPVTATVYAIVAGTVINGAIGTPQLAAMSVTSTTIADGAVGTPQLAALSVTSPIIANGAVGTPQLAALSVTSTTIADGAVTWQKIDPTTIPAAGPGLVPSGAIMMFDTDCPSGWMRDAAFDARFPLGGSSYGALGGTTTHSASISEAVRGNPVKVGTPAGAVDGEYLEDVANQFDERASGHTHTISFDGVAGPGGAVFNQLPPYISVIFCKKD